MNITIKSFQKEDIPYKIKWINDDKNNQYLHYDLPLREDKTLIWFETLHNRVDRADYTIIYNKQPVGLIGLLNIDEKNKKAEYYICLGEHEFKGKGIASIATGLLIKESKIKFGLQKIYLYTEIDNIRAQRFFEKVGFEKEGLLKNDLIHNGKNIDRYVYGLDIKSYLRNL